MNDQPNVATTRRPSSPGSQTLTPSSAPAPGKRIDEVHIVLQGKGGVGKSYVATILAEYLSERVEELRCFDTDPVNPTFSTYTVFRPEKVKLFDRDQINSKAFDDFMVPLLAPRVSGVVDNGATTFVPLMNYIKKSGALEMLVRAGKKVLVHIIIAGGDALPETSDSFTQIVEVLPEGVKAVVWLNELHGLVEHTGTAFIESPGYRSQEGRVRAVVTLPAPDGDMFARDLQDLRRARMSFGQAIAGEDRPGGQGPFNIMERQRFTMVRRMLFDQLVSRNV